MKTATVKTEMIAKTTPRRIGRVVGEKGLREVVERQEGRKPKLRQRAKID